MEPAADSTHISLASRAPMPNPSKYGSILRHDRKPLAERGHSEPRIRLAYPYMPGGKIPGSSKIKFLDIPPAGGIDRPEIAQPSCPNTERLEFQRNAGTDIGMI